MDNLTEEEIKHLGRLARIEIVEEEIPALLRSFRQIVAYFDQLGEVDVATLSPYSHVEEQEMGVLRDDVVKDTLPREVFLSNAPEYIGGMIKIPPVLKP